MNNATLEKLNYNELKESNKNTLFRKVSNILKLKSIIMNL
jgi:hypothetical protein